MPGGNTVRCALVVTPIALLVKLLNKEELSDNNQRHKLVNEMIRAYTTGKTMPGFGTDLKRSACFLHEEIDSLNIERDRLNYIVRITGKSMAGQKPAGVLILSRGNTTLLYKYMLDIMSDVSARRAALKPPRPAMRLTINGTQDDSTFDEPCRLIHAAEEQYYSSIASILSGLGAPVNVYEELGQREAGRAATTIQAKTRAKIAESKTRRELFSPIRDELMTDDEKAQSSSQSQDKRYQEYIKSNSDQDSENLLSHDDFVGMGYRRRKRKTRRRNTKK